MCNDDYLPEEDPRDTEKGGIQKCEQGWKVTLRILRNYVFDERLFNNPGGFNDDKIEIIFKTKPSLCEEINDFSLCNIMDGGVIVSEDILDGKNYGFRNIFVPWSDIASIGQRIKT